MLRITGIAILFACVLYTGLELSASLKRSISLLRAIHAFLRHAQTQIEFRGASYSEIYAAFPDSKAYPPTFVPALRNGGLNAFLSAKDTVKRLPEDAYSALSAFADAAGKSGREGQLAEIKLCANAVSDALNRLSEDFPKKSKLYVSLSITAALMLSILLI